MHSPVIIDLLILFGSAVVVGTIFNYLKLPTLISYIFAGLLVGPFGFGFVSSESEVSTITEIGIVLLMFTIGAEISLSKLWSLKRPVFGLGALQVVVTAGIACFLVKMFSDFSWSKSFFIGALIALSSTAVIMRLLNDARELVSPHGNAITGVLLFQDMIVIPFMILVPILAGQSTASSFDILGVALTVGKIIGALAGVWVFSRYIIPGILATILKTRSREIFFFFVLFFCFGIAVLFEAVGFSASLGAFVAGIIVADSPYGQHALSEITTLRDNFLGIFFLSIGMLIDPGFLSENFPRILLWVLGIFVIKCSVIFVIGKLLRYPRNIRLIAALILANVGEFSFILAEKGLSLGILVDHEFQYFLSVSILLMISTPFIYKLMQRQSSQSVFPDAPETLAAKSGIRALPEETIGNRGHAIIVGYGPAGKNVSEILKQLEIPCAIVDANYERYKEINLNSDMAYFGDSTRPEVFTEAGIDKARLVVLTISGTNMLQASLTNIRRLRPNIDVIVRVPYVNDVKALPKHPKTHLVISEYETTFELLKETLKLYEIPTKTIIGFMQLLRSQAKS